MSIDVTNNSSLEKQGKDNLNEVLRLLEIAGGKLNTEDDIVFSGTKLVIPERMSLKMAAEALIQRIEMEEEEVAFQRKFNFRPWDGAYATMNAMRKVFGMVGQVATYDFFGKHPPEMRTINISINQTVEVPWGAMTVAGLENTTFYLGQIGDPDFGLCYHISGEGPKKYRHAINGLFEMIQQELEVNSIYRGKAFDGQTNPQFLDLSAVDENKVVYSNEVMTQLNANVWANLKHAGVMEENGVSLKRAVLLAGEFGTGKTMGLHITAQRAVSNGWTAIYCRPGRDSLVDVLQTATLYQPCVVMFEDVDTIGEAGEDADHVTRVLDIFDGIKAKGTKIICMLTTNHAEVLHKGLLRSGRIDALIEIGMLDVAGIEKLTRILIRPELLANDLEFEVIAAAMDGYLPAFCKEAIERTIRYSIARNDGEVGVLVTEDFVASAVGLRPQFNLMTEASDKKADRTVDTSFRELIEATIKDTRVTRDGIPFGELKVAENDKI